MVAGYTRPVPSATRQLYLLHIAQCLREIFELKAKVKKRSS
jgi:hypothetical protein